MGEFETEVLVVGSGPTGVMLAHELALAGIGVTVIDKLAAVPAHSKEVGVPVRAVEILEQRGLLADVAEFGNAELPDAHFAQLPVALRYDGWHARHPYALGLPHQKLVEVLEPRLTERFGVRILRGHELVGLAQDDDGVTATVRTPDGELAIRASYLVGCDGPRSAVRTLAGIQFPGTDGTVSSIVADVRVGRSADWVAGEWNSVEQLFHQHRSDEGFAVLIPQPNGRHRLAGADLTNPPADRNAPVTDDEIHDLVRKSFTDEVEIAEIGWAERMSDATRHAEQYRAGRVLLAGDAAHIHFPANGQGLNMGLLDAVNLGWKLAATIRDWAPEGLLDSYHAEQHQVDARLLDNTKAQAEVTFPNPEKEPLRRTLTALLEIPQVQHYLAGLIAGLDIRYPMDGPEHPLVGARMVDVKLDVNGQVRWFSELLHEGRGVLVTVDPQHARTAQPWRDRITVTEVAKLPEVGVDAVLVRPDGYVCWVATGPDSLTWLTIALSTWFGKSTVEER
ncbi:MAG TPA: FAD-dependent monooxygenase [Pseudonocardiaceae bacterium]|jgi:anhydrotetracycline monooxygenase